MKRQEGLVGGRADGIRGRTVGCKVNEAEYVEITGHAEGLGVCLGEWCRGVLLERVRGRDPSVAERTVLAEVLALRTILLNAHFAQARRESVTEEEMRELIARADADKQKRAADRLRESAGSGGDR